MAGAMEGLSTINSFIRTIIALAVVGGVGVAGYFGYTTYNEKEFEAQAKAKALADAQDKLTKVEGDLAAAAEQIEEKDARIEEQGQQIETLHTEVDKLSTSLKLLKVEYRVARITAVDQTKDEESGEISTLIEFVELNDEGAPIDTAKQFRINGDTVYIDGWVVKFEDEYVENADLEKGTALILLKRIFGSGQKPDDGYPLDEVGSAPRAYARGGKMSDFEKGIWDNFWSLAASPDKWPELGIRNLSGDAKYTKVTKGKSYRFSIRSTGETSLVQE
jgi:hypothetical protein